MYVSAKRDKNAKKFCKNISEFYKAIDKMKEKCYHHLGRINYLL